MNAAAPLPAPACPPYARGLRIFNTGHALQVEWDELVDNKATMPVLGE